MGKSNGYADAEKDKTMDTTTKPPITLYFVKEKDKNNNTIDKIKDIYPAIDFNSGNIRLLFLDENFFYVFEPQQNPKLSSNFFIYVIPKTLIESYRIDVRR